MTNHHQILGVSQAATRKEIQAAFEQQWNHWQQMQSNPLRAKEAQKKLEQLEIAYQEALQRLESLEGGLEFGSGEKQHYASMSGTDFDGAIASNDAGLANSQAVDKDSCPNCSFNENPNNARYCIECHTQLFQLCPKCNLELAWHQKGCHHCGVNIQDYKHDAAIHEAITGKNNQIFQLRDTISLLRNASSRSSFRKDKKVTETRNRLLSEMSSRLFLYIPAILIAFLVTLYVLSNNDISRWVSYYEAFGGSGSYYSEMTIWQIIKRYLLFMTLRDIIEFSFIFLIFYIIIFYITLPLINPLVLSPIANRKITVCEHEIQKLEREVNHQKQQLKYTESSGSIVY